jgi:DNA polymerase III gamma/tau subunit
MADKIETTIIGQDATIEILNKVIDNPPHIFLTGLHGCGKTTLAKHFVTAYFKKNGITWGNPDYLMELSSEKDRGMATVRTKLADFTREAPIIPGVYRWIIIDDADTLPLMSQQALRRPMEQYSHLTRFLFITSAPSDLIAPLRSRCFHIQVAPLSLTDYGPQLLKNEGIDPASLSPEVLQWLSSAALGIPAEYIHFAKAVSLLGYAPSIGHIRAICAAPPFEQIIPLIKNIVPGNEEALLNSLLGVWYDGFGFEDVLENMYNTVDLFMILQPPHHEQFLTILARGWESQVRARVSLLDLLRLFFVSDIAFSPAPTV